MDNLQDVGRNAAASAPVPIAVLNGNVALLSSLVVFLLIMIEVVITQL